MEQLLQKADEYFECHLNRSDWLTFSDDERRAALAMAQMQTACELGTEKLDEENIFIICAVCEQALFLAMNRIRRMPEDGRGVWLKSESIEGAGSRSFELYDADKENQEWSGRAKIFLQRAGGGNICIGKG